MRSPLTAECTAEFTAEGAVVTDLLGDEVLADPYPLYDRWRDESAIQPVRFPSGLVVWQVSGAREARAMLTDPRFSTALRRLQRAGILGLDYAVGASMLTSDPPRHTRLRRLVNRAFTARRIEQLRPRVRAIVDSLLDTIARHEEVDLVTALADPVPTIVICELIGVPEADRDRFGHWTKTLIKTATTPAEQAARREALRAQHQYWRELARERAAQVSAGGHEDDQPDLLSALLVAHDEDRLSEPELLAMLNLLVIAGLETTTNMLANSLLALLRHPDQLQLLRAQPELLPAAIDELVRYDGPVQRGDFRIALADVTIGEVTIPAGAAVVVVFGAANRDDREFPDPARLDVCRGAREHLAFGHGPHYCLGAQLARLEAEIVIGGLLARFPELTPVDPPEEVRRGPQSLFVRGVVSLRVRPHGGPERTGR